MNNVIGRYRAVGRRVVSGGRVCRVRGSNRAARKTARRLNALYRAKMHGVFVPPSDSFSITSATN
jgi:transposase